MRGDNEIQQLIDHRTGPCVDIPNGEYVGDVTVPAGVTLSCEYGTRIRGIVTLNEGAMYVRPNRATCGIGEPHRIKMS